ncbi:MAG: LuxR C-terminal-related transcriptional regulator [Elsteraceae bacterium]
MAHIFVADDHPMYLDAVCATLSRHLPGYTIHQAFSVDDLLGKLAAHRAPVALALLDLNMPGMDSGDGVQVIRASLPDATIALMSGVATLADVRKSLSLGAKGFLSKTMRPEHFASAISLILQGGTYVPAELLQGEAADARPAASAPEAGALSGLSPRETEVLRLLSAGMTNKEIGRDLGLAEMTVKLHVRQILRKLGARNRAEAATIALRLGLDATESKIRLP